MRPDQSGRIYIFTVSSSPATYYNTKVVSRIFRTLVRRDKVQ